MGCSLFISVIALGESPGHLAHGLSRAIDDTGREDLGLANNTCCFDFPNLDHPMGSCMCVQCVHRTASFSPELEEVIILI